jgi:hypothetical protein
MSQLRWPGSPPTLTGGSLRLRLGLQDAGAVFAACQDPGIQRWTRGRCRTSHSTRPASSVSLGSSLGPGPACGSARGTAVGRLGCEREGVLRSKAVVRDQRRDMALYALVKP